MCTHTQTSKMKIDENILELFSTQMNWRIPTVVDHVVNLKIKNVSKNVLWPFLPDLSDNFLHRMLRCVSNVFGKHIKMHHSIPWYPKFLQDNGYSFSWSLTSFFGLYSL